jgi:hypothetical protein
MQVNSGLVWLVKTYECVMWQICGGDNAHVHVTYRL